MKKAALNWLSRQLYDAILKFIDQAKKGDILLGCFYEFHYLLVVQAFRTECAHSLYSFQVFVG